MGNYVCCYEIDDPIVVNYHKSRERLVKYNLNFIQEITSMRVSNTSQRIVAFHKNILHMILTNTNFGYSPQNFIYNQQDKKKSRRLQLYEFAKNELSLTNQHIFKQIIISYIQFLQEEFGLQLPQYLYEESENKRNVESFQSISDFYDRSPQWDNLKSKGSKNSNTTIQEDMKLQSSTFLSNSIKVDFQKEIQQAWISLVKAKLKGQKNLYHYTKILIFQTNFIFKLTAELIREVYYEVFNMQIGLSAELLPTKEIFIQRLIQHFLLSKNYPVIYVLQILGEQFYIEEDKKLQAETIVVGGNENCSQQTMDGKNEHILDHTLVPHSVHQDELQLNFEGMDDSSFGQADEKIELFRQSRDILPEATKQQFQSMVEKSEKVVKSQSIPYQETFSLITKIVETQKFWKKFRLIQKLDKIIVFLFMRKRTESQYIKYFDTISAEDSKSEIIFHIIYQYLRRRQIDMNLQLYVPLRLMHDQDGFLHNDIKFIFCPPFLRFYSIVELIINSEYILN